jgi:hypothetical protein
MILYHKTNAENVGAILRDGFMDAIGCYLTDTQHTGVWLSDNPDACVGRGVLFELRFSGTEAELSDFEWVEEGKKYREWLVPAAFVNSRMSFKVLEED